MLGHNPMHGFMLVSGRSRPEQPCAEDRERLLTCQSDRFHLRVEIILRDIPQRYSVYARQQELREYLVCPFYLLLPRWCSFRQYVRVGLASEVLNSKYENVAAGREAPIGFIIGACEEAQEFRIAQNVVEVKSANVGMELIERPSGMEVFEQQSLFAAIQRNEMSDLRLFPEEIADKPCSRVLPFS